MQQPKTYRTERDFGFLVGGVLATLGGWWLFRGKFQVFAIGAVGLGSVLILLAAVNPKTLIIPNRVWMALGYGLSIIFTPVILAIVFFGVITPIGILRRLAGGDPLRRRSESSHSYWTDYSNRRSEPHHYEKMY